jgi:hypothetical protein
MLVPPSTRICVAVMLEDPVTVNAVALEELTRTLHPDVVRLEVPVTDSAAGALALKA